MRSRIFDQMQVYPFWLVDLIAPWQAVPAFQPALGFRSCTAPEITAETKEIRAGNEYFPYHVITGGTLSPIALDRGVVWWAKDFLRWFQTGLQGGRKVRRDIMLIHYMSRTLPSPGQMKPEDLADVALGNLVVGSLLGMTIGEMSNLKGVEAATGAFAGATVSKGAAAGVNQLMQAAGIGNSGQGEFAARIPGRAWIFYKCIPTKYKAGTDFDATSGDVSIQECEFQPHDCCELSIG